MLLPRLPVVRAVLGLTEGHARPVGGTDVVAVRPRYMSFSQGQERLVCMSLSAAGLLRWYTNCCKTPIGNTPRDGKVPHLGLVHTCLEAPGVGLDDSFGPVRMQVNAASANGPTERNSPIALRGCRHRLSGVDGVDTRERKPSN